MKRLVCLLLLLTCLFSVALASNSDALTERKTILPNGYRIDYLDASGQIVLAEDKGYATVIWIEAEAVDDPGVVRTMTGHYYDAAGEPVSHIDGYYGRIKAYNASGQVVRVTYLDADDLPTNCRSGYAVVQRDYPEDDAMREMYFTAEGTPVVLSAGHSGLLRHYNEAGQTISYTYLDAQGQPVMSSYGYDSVHRSFDADGRISQEMYFLHGQPVALEYGQYGTAYVYRDGQEAEKQLLDRNGNVFFNPLYYLSRQPLAAMLFCLLLVPLTALLPKKLRMILLAGGTLLILYLTIFARNAGATNVILLPFSSFQGFFEGTAVLVYENILVFLPFGFLLFSIWPHRRVILITFLFSLTIELTQLILRLGWFEVDDLICNTLGGAIGCAFCAGINRLRQHFSHTQSAKP